MTDETTGLTEAEQLAALETYLKPLKAIADNLRARVTADMGKRHVEKVGAYLPDGTKMASVGLSDGNVSVKVTDPAAALKWCIEKYPEELVEAVNPAFLKKLTEHAKAVGKVGDPGVDPHTGEMLPFIEVVKGNPFVRVTTTEEGVQRMEALAHGFAGMLEAAAPAPAGGTIKWADGKVTSPDWTGAGAPSNYDSDFADRLENGAYPSS
jgi:hypothetical protein